MMATMEAVAHNNGIPASSTLLSGELGSSEDPHKGQSVEQSGWIRFVRLWKGWPSTVCPLGGKKIKTFFASEVEMP